MEQGAEQWLTYRWQKGNRYYVAELMQDLFGTWLLKRTWGSIDTYGWPQCQDHEWPKIR